MQKQNIAPVEKTIPFDLSAGLVKAVGTITSDATNPDAADTITIDTTEYTFRSTLTAAVAAAGVLTSDTTNPTEDDTVTIGDITYTFKDALTYSVDKGPRANIPYEILIGVDTDATMQALADAINCAPNDSAYGTTFSFGTKKHPSVTSGDVTTNAITVTAITAGTAGNAIAKSEDSDHLDWDGAGAVFTGGVDTIANEIKIGASAAVTLDNIKAAINGTGTPGTEYSVGTVAHTTVTATTNADTTQLIQAVTGGVAGNAIVFTEDAAHISMNGSGTLGTTTAGGGTKAKYTVADGGGFAHRFITTIPALTGSPTVAVAIYTENDLLVKTLAATQAESNQTDTAYEVELRNGDYVLFTASGTVSDAAAEAVKLQIR